MRNYTAEQNFHNAASTYDDAASTQRAIAAQLVQHIVAAWEQAGRDVKEAVSILDIGCGTGFVMEGLADAFPNATLFAVDQSSAMLAKASQKMQAKKRTVETICCDAAALALDWSFDVVASSMCLQWMMNPAATFAHWRAQLAPEGLMVVALPVEGTFPEWTALCEDIGVPSRLRSLPAVDFLRDPSVAERVERYYQDYETGLAFATHLKETGASAAANVPELTFVQKQALIAKLKQQRPFSVTWTILSLTTGPLL